MTSSNLHLSGLLIAVTLQACGDDPVASASPAGATGRDAAVDASAHSTDAAQGMDAGALAPPPGSVCSGELPVMSVLNMDTNAEEAPDWTCYAEAQDAPAPPPARQVTFSLGKSVGALLGRVDGLIADVFFGSSTLGKPATSLKFDAGNTARMLDVPAGVTQLSARMHALEAADPIFNTSEIRDYDLRIPYDGMVEGTTVLTGSYNLAVDLALSGDKADPSKAALGADVRDCLGRDVGGAVFELIDGETDQPVMVETRGNGPRVAYQQFALPNPSCTFTSVGRSDWMMLNAPVNVSGDEVTHRYRLRLKGRMRETDREPRVLGEREIELFAGSITAVRLYKQVEACTAITSSLERCR